MYFCALKFWKNMEITIGQLLLGAKAAKGVAVVIDVFRAFSVSCYLFDKGVKAVYPVADIAIAYRLKQEHPEWLLIGERNEKKPEGFDYGNSPTQFLSDDLTGKTIVHTTSSGTQGLLAAAVGADVLLTGSFVNADAIVSYIKSLNPKYVTLCCMGYATLYPTEEDTFCAEYIKAKLEGTAFDFEQKTEEIKRTSGARFFEGHAHAPESDYNLCLKTGVFDFVLEAKPLGDGILELHKRVTS